MGTHPALLTPSSSPWLVLQLSRAALAQERLENTSSHAKPCKSPSCLCGMVFSGMGFGHPVLLAGKMWF